jgi:putative Mn2+ efflux pump MntP
MRRNLIFLVLLIGCPLLFAAISLSIDAAIAGTQFALARAREMGQFAREMGPIFLTMLAMELTVAAVIGRYWHRYN